MLTNYSLLFNFDFEFLSVKVSAVDDAVILKPKEKCTERRRVKSGANRSFFTNEPLNFFSHDDFLSVRWQGTA